MKTWVYFYIEHTIKNGEIFRSYPGWAVWHSCFITVHRQMKNNYKFILTTDYNQSNINS